MFTEIASLIHLSFGVELGVRMQSFSFPAIAEYSAEQKNKDLITHPYICQYAKEQIGISVQLGIEFYLFVSHEAMKRQRFHVWIS